MNKKVEEMIESIKKRKWVKLKKLEHENFFVEAVKRIVEKHSEKLGE